MNCDDRAIVLLNLLLPEGKLRDEGNIETIFDHLVKNYIMRAGRCYGNPHS